MKDKITPASALAALRSLTGALYRHGPDGSREFLSLATRLETGVWAGVSDYGIFPGKVYGEFCGTEVVVDLFLHLISENGGVNELPVKWAMRTTMAPIALLGVPGDQGEAPQIAPSAEMTWPQYQNINRPDLRTRNPRQELREQITFDQPVNGVVGCIYEEPMIQTYRCGSDRNSKSVAICVSANFDYASDAYVGCPVVDDFGRLVGIAIGVAPGPERGHVGMYLPADYLMPSLAMAHASYEAMLSRQRYSTGIELVKFWNSEVTFEDDAWERGASTHRLDQMLKVVLPRWSWNSIIEAAAVAEEQSIGTDAASPHLEASMTRLREAVLK